LRGVGVLFSVCMAQLFCILDSLEFKKKGFLHTQIWSIDFIWYVCITVSNESMKIFPLAKEDNKQDTI